jgi:hypothetical protein
MDSAVIIGSSKTWVVTSPTVSRGSHALANLMEGVGRMLGISDGEVRCCARWHGKFIIVLHVVTLFVWGTNGVENN